MRASNELEHAHRRRYHLAVGFVVCVTIYTVIVVAARVVMG